MGARRWIVAAATAWSLLLSPPAIAQGTTGPPPADKAALDDAARLTDEGVKLQEAGRYDDAVARFQQALAIREKVLGEDSYDTAEAANNLATIYQDKGDYPRAEALMRRTVTIVEKLLGPEDANVGTALNNLGLLVHLEGDYARAEPLYLRALAIREKALGPEDPAVAQTVNNLGGLYNGQGNSTRAATMYERALAIREKALGPDHLDVAGSLDNLAALYSERGEPARAEPLQQRALAIREKALGPDHPTVALSLHNLAMVYQNEGDHDQAIALTERALAIREKTLGPWHPDLALTLNNLGAFYRDRGDHQRAESASRRALAIWEKSLGPDHSRVAIGLINLAQLLVAEGKRDEAEPLYERALGIQMKALGPRHPDAAVALSSLADLVQQRGDNARAEELYQRALEIRDKLGFDHDDTTVYLRRLGLAKARAGDERFLSLLERAEAMTDRLSMPILATGSEEQKRLYMRTVQERTEQLVGVHLGFAWRSPAAARLALTEIFRRKGRVLDAMTDMFASLRRHLTPEAQALLDKLSTIDGQLATQISRGPGASPLDRYQAGITSLEAERRALEAKLGALSADFSADQQLVETSYVQAAIPDRAALVEIVRYRRAPPKATDAWGEPRYAAYVLHRRGDPKAVDLGEAAPIDAAVKALRQALGDHDLTHDPRPAARALDLLVMDPLRPLLADVRQALLSPDADLALVPFEALLDADGHYEVTRFAFSYLATGRDLLRFRGEAPRASERPLLLGDPAFDAVTDGSQEATERADATRGLRSVAMIKGPFERLKSTGEEVRAIARFFPDARVLLGPDATEGALKSARAPRILHLSTHGFFLPEQAGSTREAENPLLRAGLLFAGADQRRSHADDGILTALEAANLDLYGTRLVVLATCESGLGQAVSGDGVYGMRRALTMAGAETQVMSLWEVSSGATKALMTRYYERLSNGEGRVLAMRDVELEMLDNPATAHPHLWAGFIVSGSGARLDGKPASMSWLRVAPGARGCGCALAGDAAPRPPGLLLTAALFFARLARRRVTIVAKHRAL
ncbi:MAG: tetratricopeptide repeat protein [Byssovorax sp.]